MNADFILTYIIIPVIVGTGIMSGKLTENHLRTGLMIGFKSVMYFYYALTNVINFINEAWVVRYLAGLTIALSIMESLAGIAEAIVEFRKNYKNKIR